MSNKTYICTPIHSKKFDLVLNTHKYELRTKDYSGKKREKYLSG